MLLKNQKGLVLHQDEDLLVVNKPTGLLVLPDGYDLDTPHLKSILSPSYGDLWILHRLDRHTSGLVVLARNSDAHRTLNSQFERRQVVKCYHALTVGCPDWTERTINLRLRIDGDRRHRTVIDARRGKPSSTHFQLLEPYARYALIEAAPRTGRTHQIRTHLAAIGFPILADDLYGGGRGLYLSQIKPNYLHGTRKPERPLLDRLGLHAYSLRFAHPTTGENLEFRAPYPKDFAAALRQLRKYTLS
jgi:RluA family pseudouridine synthase